MTARIFALAAGLLISVAGPIQAEGNLPPPKTFLARFHPRTGWGPNFAGEDYAQRGNFWYRVGMRSSPAILPSSNAAPWYLWWPANANEQLMQHDFQTSPYPTWPTSMPPMDGSGRPQGQMTYGQQPSFTPPNPFQPVNYPPAQVPSYWYGR